MKFNSFMFEKELTLQFNKTLQPDIWDIDSDNAEPTLKKDVRKHLLAIADAWAEYANIPKKHIKNILFTGSLANFNWTKYSDIDLHVLVDYDAMSKDFDFLYDYFKDKKSLWAENHNVTIKGYPVEMYAQPMSEKPKTNQGVYSVSSNKWIKSPEPVEVNVSDDIVFLKKVDSFKEQIDDILKGKGSVASVEKFRDKIKNMRGAAITKAGEFSQENLLFKELRNSGYLDKLAKYHHELVDKKLSLEQEQNKIMNDLILEKTKNLKNRTNILLGEANEEEYEKIDKVKPGESLQHYYDILKSYFTDNGKLKSNTLYLSPQYLTSPGIIAFYGNNEELLKFLKTFAKKANLFVNTNAEKSFYILNREGKFTSSTNGDWKIYNTVLFDPNEKKKKINEANEEEYEKNGKFYDAVHNIKKQFPNIRFLVANTIRPFSLGINIDNMNEQDKDLLKNSLAPSQRKNYYKISLSEFEYKFIRKDFVNSLIKQGFIWWWCNNDVSLWFRQEDEHVKDDTKITSVIKEVE